MREGMRKEKKIFLCFPALFFSTAFLSPVKGAIAMGWLRSLLVIHFFRPIFLSFHPHVLPLREALCRYKRANAHSGTRSPSLSLSSFVVLEP